MDVVADSSDTGRGLGTIEPPESNVFDGAGGDADATFGGSLQPLPSLPQEFWQGLDFEPAPALGSGLGSASLTASTHLPPTACADHIEGAVPHNVSVEQGAPPLPAHFSQPAVVSLWSRIPLAHATLV